MADLLGKTGPSLSATSDMPAVETPATTDAAEPAAVTDTPETAHVDEGATAETKAEDAATGDDTAGTETDADKSGKDDTTPPWMKREITKARNRQREAERLAAEANQRLDAALKALERQTGQSADQATKKADADDPRPKRETFDDPQAYDEALIEWSSRRASTAAATEARKESIAAQQKAEQTRIQSEWGEKVAKVADKYPDFEDVAYSAEVPVTFAMSNAILLADNGPDLAYHLGKNPEVAKRIAALNPVQQAMEMGKLSVSLLEKPSVSRAPPPVRPIGTRAAAAAKSPDEMSMEEYAARRLPELRARRGAGAR